MTITMTACLTTKDGQPSLDLFADVEDNDGGVANLATGTVTFSELLDNMYEAYTVPSNPRTFSVEGRREIMEELYGIIPLVNSMLTQVQSTEDWNAPKPTVHNPIDNLSIDSLSDAELQDGIQKFKKELNRRFGQL